MEKTSILIFTTHISTILEVLTGVIMQEKIKGIRNIKEETKLFLFKDNMIFYVENFMEFTKKLVELIYEFNKVSGSSAGESAHHAGDPGCIPGSGRSPGEGLGYLLQYSWASLLAQMVKNPPAMWETWV